MTIKQKKGTHVSRYFESLRIKQGLKPSQIAASLGASNISKIGSLIRQFELTGEISFYWFQKLVDFLNPEKDELQRCLKLDQNIQLTEFNKWASQTIDPYLIIRYMPAVYALKEVPAAFKSSRKEAEEWCSKELKSYRAKGYLNWTRREQTFFEKGGSNLWRCSATFEEPPLSAWMQVSGSSEKFIFKEELTSTDKIKTKTEVRP